MRTPSRTASGPLLLLIAGLFTLSACDAPEQSLAAPDAAFDATDRAPELSVMTRNMYFGADVENIIGKSGIELLAAIAQAWGQFQANDFETRMAAMADEIASRAPDVVGLQEVVTMIHAPLGPDGQPVMSEARVYAALPGLLAALADRGVVYHPAVLRTTMQVPPLPVFDFTLTPPTPVAVVSLQDADAILVRDGVSWRDPLADGYTVYNTYQMAGHQLEHRRGWTSVEVEVGTQWVRVFNTHLETQFFPATQIPQAEELLGLAEASELPVILLGDLNSAANRDAPERARTDTYRLLLNAGFSDTWLRGNAAVGGGTCCHDKTLSNPDPTLEERLDLVLVRSRPGAFAGRADSETTDERQNGLWPSDHAGLYARLWFAPGTLTD